MITRRFIKRLLHRFGFDIIRFNARSSPLARRIKLFDHFGIDLVFDVGASTGGYARELREYGYRGRIISFEPSTKAFSALKGAADKDPSWEISHMALGKETGSAQLHLSANNESSSFLNLKKRHTSAYPSASYVGTETVVLSCLDDEFSKYYREGSKPFLKIDTQGFELQVLYGAEVCLRKFVGVQVELSLTPLYEGEPSYLEIISHLQERGFSLMSFQPVIDDPRTGQLLQVDGLFFAEGS